MAFSVTINGRTYTLADFEGTNYVDGFPDALEDFVTQAGNIYTTTSTSSVAIGAGSKTFTVADSGKPYIVGTPLRIADVAAPSTNWIDGIVTSYSGTTLIPRTPHATTPKPLRSSVSSVRRLRKKRRHECKYTASPKVA